MENLSVTTPTSWVYSITAATKGTIRTTRYFSVCGTWPLQDLWAICERSGKMTETSLLPVRLVLAVCTPARGLENGYWSLKTRKILPHIYREHEFSGTHIPLADSSTLLFSLAGSSISSTQRTADSMCIILSQIKEPIQMYPFTNYASLALLGIRKVRLYNYLYATDLFAWH